MKKTLLLLTSLSLFAAQASATPSTVILNFDDITGGSIQNNLGNMATYKGFTFSSTLFWIDVEDSPWSYGAVSQDFAMYNNTEGVVGTITEENGADFTFDGLWAKKLNTPKNSSGANSLFGTLQGYNNGVQVWSVDTGLNGSYDFYGAQSGSIDELRLGFGNFFLVDNLTLTAVSPVPEPGSLNTVSPVPEPSSIALMLGGLGLVGFMAARRAKKA